jgi:hypothetical protein
MLNVGLMRPLLAKFAEQSTASSKVTAHARDELALYRGDKCSIIQAALASMGHSRFGGKAPPRTTSRQRFHVSAISMLF